MANNSMKVGDHAWLTGLQGAAPLNGKHVVLHEWIEDKRRWRCQPHDWTHTEPFIGVKPQNLSNEPPAVGMDMSDGSSFQERLNKTKTDAEIMDLLRDTPQDEFRKFASSYGLYIDGECSGGADPGVRGLKS